MNCNHEAIRGAVAEAICDTLPRDEYPTLRDRFAMAALPACIADAASYGEDSALAKLSGAEYVAGIAIGAYRFADAMLAARVKKP